MYNPEFPSLENLEKPKYHYTYTDSNVLGHPNIFECDADDDIEAREKFYTFVQESGLDIRESDISCSTINN